LNCCNAHLPFTLETSLLKEHSNFVTKSITFQLNLHQRTTKESSGRKTYTSNCSANLKESININEDTRQQDKTKKEKYRHY
jgi:hypothetical protein